MPPASSLRPWRSKVVLYGLCLLGFWLRVQGLTTQSLWRDEVDSWRFAKAATVALLFKPGWNGPAYQLLLRGWIALAGESEYALRFPSALAAAAYLPLCWHLARQLSDARSALLALLLLTCAPYHIWYAQEAKMYAILSLLSLSSFVALLQAMTRGGLVTWAAYVLVMLPIPYVHILGVLLLPAQVCAIVVASQQFGVRKVSLFVLCLSIPALAYLLLARWQVPLVLKGFSTGHPYYTLPQMSAILARVWPLGVAAASKWWLAIPHAVGLSAAATLAFRRAAWHLRFLLSWLLIPAVLVHIISLRSPVFADRYLMGSYPAFVLLLAIGLGYLIERWKWPSLTLMGLAISVGLYGVYVQSHYSIKTDARGAARITATGWRAGDVLLLQIPYLEHSVSYYLGPGWPAVAGPYTNTGIGEQPVARYLADSLGGYKRVWLWLSEAEMWDKRGLTLSWLEANCVLRQKWTLARITVYLFEDCSCLSATEQKAEGTSIPQLLVNGQQSLS